MPTRTGPASAASRAARAVGAVPACAALPTRRATVLGGILGACTTAWLRRRAAAAPDPAPPGDIYPT
ncbi:hypothetical protein ABTZ93_08500 [Streptomyces sp. NPDC097941]|uniref:hypothetical protein n=1 Tax=Streptomyces sp. NPDC097941 TaxID=3155685 RepID=UPI003331DD64